MVFLFFLSSSQVENIKGIIMCTAKGCREKIVLLDNLKIFLMVITSLYLSISFIYYLVKLPKKLIYLINIIWILLTAFCLVIILNDILIYYPIFKDIVRFIFVDYVAVYYLFTVVANLIIFINVKNSY
ncbi:hypothetical protein LJB88_02320 [Erysipelotrichaceae bacterium OttesenSCG-928-M19]|nr:hypothetical protein [Erysipelotrichaceae bacterium OttesenSCG-928-M19]